MVKNMDLNDFRAIRRVLEPDDFALSDGEPDLPPTDLIDRKAWEHIMDLPGHVEIVTTNYQGSKIALLHDLSSEWIFSMPDSGITGDAMLAIYDNLEATIFNAVHGHYKTALAILRVALETSVVAARCALAGDLSRWERWNGGSEFKFGHTCDEVLRLPDVKAREDEVVAEAGTGIFQRDASTPRGGWARSLSMADFADTATPGATQRTLRFGIATDQFTPRKVSRLATRRSWRPSSSCSYWPGGVMVE